MHEAKFSRFLGGHVQRIGNSSGEMCTLSRRGKGDAVLRWYVKYSRREWRFPIKKHWRDLFDTMNASFDQEGLMNFGIGLM